MVTARYFIIEKSDLADKIKIKSKREMKALRQTDKGSGRYDRLDEIESVDTFLTDFATAKGILVEEIPIDELDDEPILDLLHTFYPCASFTHKDIEYTVVRGIVCKETLEAFGKFSGKSALGADSLTALGLEKVIAGTTEAELIDFVLANFGIDLSGERQVGTDEDGKPVYGPYIIPCRMAGE